MTGRIERLREKYDITVTWKAFPLHPETPEEGRSLVELFGGNEDKVASMLAHLQTTANQLGLPFSPRTYTFNSRLAQELGKWAETTGKADEYHLAVFKAYFANGKNIGDLKTLLQIVGSLGLSEVTAKEVLSACTYEQVVDRDWQESRDLGITAVPTLVMGRDCLVGAQPYEVIEQLLQKHGISLRT